METIESHLTHGRPASAETRPDTGESTIPPDLPDDDGPLTEEDWERFNDIIFEHFVAEP